MGENVWPKQRPNIALPRTPREPSPPWFRGHWRGELSLPVSVFANGLLGALIMPVALLIPSFVVFLFDRESLNAFYAIALGMTALLVYAIWSLVGIWRSAGQHEARGGSRFAALAARAACIAALTGLLVFTPLAIEIVGVAIGDPDIDDYNIHVLQGGREIEFFGGMKDGAARDLKAALDAAPEVRTVHLTSPGGRPAVAERMRKVIVERGLDTYAPLGCNSACTTAFLGGKHRYVNGEERIGFHGVGGPVSLLRRSEAELNADYAGELIDIGVEENFARRATAIPNSDIWRPTVEELIAAGVATEVAEGQFAMSGFGATPGRDTVNDAMMKVPLFAALEGAEPDVHAAVLDTYLDGLRTGRPEGKVSAAVHELVRPLLAKYMPVAPDLSVNALGLAFTEELSSLPAASADCHAIYLSEDRERRLAAREAIPFALRKQTAAAIAGVITDGIEKGDPSRVPTKAQKAKVARKAMTALKRNHSARTVAASLALARGEKVTGPDSCNAMTAIYVEASKLPQAEAAIMWRSLLGNQS
jgi:hypothetical protein